MLENLKTERKSSHGGARIGAGRKPRAQHEARERFNVVVDKHADKLAKLAIYHAAKGDKDMLRWIIEQRIGRPSQSVDTTSQTVAMQMTVSETLPQRDIMEIAARAAAELKKEKTM